MKKHSKEFVISYRDVNIEGILKTSSLVDFMQDVAREHANMLHVNFEKSSSEYYWIILRTKINILAMPKIDETIRIETFPSGVDKLFCVREFVIYDKDNNKLGDIKGYYLLMEYHKKMPIKIKDNPHFSLFNNPYEGEKLGKLTHISEEIQKTIKRRVFSSDIDANNHMNNSHYVRWCFDMYDTKVLDKKLVKSFQIQYTKEVLENDEVDVFLYTDGYIVGKHNDEISFTAKIEFSNQSL